MRIKIALANAYRATPGHPTRWVRETSVTILPSCRGAGAAEAPHRRTAISKRIGHPLEYATTARARATSSPA